VKSKAAMPSVWLLGLASGLSPFGITMAVPVLATIAAGFEVEFGAAQFVISAYLFGLAIAQPFNGFLCDRFGRRPVMLSGFIVFVAASFAAAFTQSISALIAFRFLQALGVSVGTVASRAVVRDTRGAAGSAEAMAYIAAIMGFAPIIAPILGGWLGALGGYSAVFLSTALMGAVIWVLMFFSLDETLDPGRATPAWSDWMRNYRILFTSPAFIAYSLIFGFVQGSFFAFLAVGSAVFQSDFGIGARDFGLIWGLMAITYVTGAVVCGRLTRRLGSAPVMNAAVLITLVSGWILTFLVLLFGTSLGGLLAPLAVLMVAAGGITPGSLAGAVNAHPEMAGTASGLSSAIGIVVGGTFTVVAGFVYQGDFAPVSWLVGLSASLTALSWGLVRWAHKRAR
jgi:DHA1 family bicyclomycin/chloramphenicol resistance-like MFS transporter